MLNHEWQPEWHYIDEGDIPSKVYLPILFETENDEIFLAYWGDKYQNPHKIIRWTYLPDSLYNRHQKCNCYITKNNKTYCLGTKEIDPCSCEGIPRYCDFYDYMRKR
jgi:hypothetical protein